PLEGTLYHQEFKTSFTGKFKNFWERHGNGVCTDKNGVQKDCYFINDYDFTEEKPLESIYPLRKDVHALIEEGKDFLIGTVDQWHSCNSAVSKIKFGRGDSWAARRAYDDVVDDFEEREYDLKKLTKRIEDLIQKMKDNPQFIDEKGFDRLITDKYVGFATIEDSFYFYLNNCLRKGDRAVKDLNKIEDRRKQREKEAAEYKAKIWAPSNFTALTNKDDPALRMLKQHQEAIRQAQEFNRKTQLTSSYSTQAALGTFGTTSTISNKQNSVVMKNTELQSSKKENTQRNTQKSNTSIKLPTSTYSQGKTSQITLPNKEKQTVKSPTVPMEQFQEAIAYCAEFVSGGWKCNGPIQKIMVKVNTVEEGLKDVGCSTARHHVAYIPDGGDPKTQGAVYYCGYGLRNSDRNITKNMTIPTSLLNQRKNYQCPRSQLKRCETEL
ncbi:MAG: hypothetical protein O2928_12870, partial [Proteobacteria bacterium]|nr:hypothetical protein [Pseudomonadota bacterium]